MTQAPGLSRRDGALLFLLALLPRLAHWACVRHTPLASDFVPDLSAYLLAVERLMQSAYFFAEPMVMSPGYALVLAPQYILAGPDVPLFVLVNAVLDAVSAVLCAGLAFRLAASVGLAERSRAAGVLAGGLYACCGGLLFYTLLPLGEGPAIFCLLAGLSLLLDAPERPAPAAWLSGALLALAALIRPNLAPAALLAVVAWGLGPGRRQAALRCLLGFLIVLAPFMAHNAKVAGRPSPFGFQGGFTLYSGNHPGASGVGDSLPGFENTPYMVLLRAWGAAEEGSGRELTQAEADAWWYGQTWRFFAEHPGEAAGLMARKMLLLLNNSGIDATANQGFCARFSPVPGWLALPAGLVFALALAGLWRALALRRKNGTSLALALALALALFAAAGLVLLFQVTPRYRVVLLPLALPFAGLALADWRALLAGHGRGLLRHAPLALFLLALAASLVPLRLLVDKPGIEALEHARLARYYLARGPQELARAEFAHAIRLGAPDQEALKAGLAASLSLSPPSAKGQ